MILSLSAISLVRTKLTAAAVGTLILTAGHAIAKNHDVQRIRLSPSVQGLHDKAPGPLLRNPG